MKNRFDQLEAGLTHPFPWMSSKSNNVKSVSLPLPDFFGRLKDTCLRGTIHWNIVFILSFAQDIDSYIAQLKESGYDTFVRVSKNGLSMAAETMIKTAATVIIFGLCFRSSFYCSCNSEISVSFSVFFRHLWLMTLHNTHTRSFLKISLKVTVGHQDQ